MPGAIIFLADGTEEMEFTIVYDTLVRGGIQCTSVYVPETGNSARLQSEEAKPMIATCSRGVKIVADAVLGDQSVPTDVDLLVVPGGAKGAETISQNETVQRLIKGQLERDLYVGMICAGSLAAKTSGLPHLALTSHPSVKEQLEAEYEYREDPVVIDGKLVTSRGPGTAFPFALALVENLQGQDKRVEVQGPMVFPAGAI